MHFNSLASFLDWKAEEEIKTHSNYVQRCAPQIRGDAKTYYYYCNRSGFYTHKGKGKRLLKAQGSCKLEEYCTAHITAKHLSDLSVEIEYCAVHPNHEIDLAHICIPESVRLSIATKLTQGVKIN